jgi:hypothetical protein
MNEVDRLVTLTRHISVLEMKIEALIEGQSQIANGLAHLIRLAESKGTKSKISNDASVSEEEVEQFGTWVLRELGWPKALEKMLEEGFVEHRQLERLGVPGDRGRIFLLGSWLLSKHAPQTIRNKMKDQG